MDVLDTKSSSDGYSDGEDEVETYTLDQEVEILRLKLQRTDEKLDKARGHRKTLRRSKKKEYKDADNAVQLLSIKKASIKSKINYRLKKREGATLRALSNKSPLITSEEFLVKLEKERSVLSLEIERTRLIAKLYERDSDTKLLNGMITERKRIYSKISYHRKIVNESEPHDEKTETV